MSLRERILSEIDRIDDDKLTLVSDYLAFLRFRSRSVPRISDDASLKALYAEFAEEDRAMAEEGMEEYAAQLDAEDRA